MTEAKTIKFQNEVRMMKEKTSNRLGVHSFMLMTLVAIVTFAARGTSAQTTMVNADGLATKNFKTAQGTIQINLPSEMTGPVSVSYRTFSTRPTTACTTRD